MCGRCVPYGNEKEGGRLVEMVVPKMLLKSVRVRKIDIVCVFVAVKCEMEETV